MTAKRRAVAPVTVTQRARTAAGVTVTQKAKTPAGVTKTVKVGQTVGGECPASAPIKGNASSMIYHVPGGEFYDRTNPEKSFATEAAARAAGYRASKR